MRIAPYHVAMVELEDTPGLNPGRLCSVRVQVPLATFMSRYDGKW